MPMLLVKQDGKLESKTGMLDGVSGVLGSTGVNGFRCPK